MANDVTTQYQSAVARVASFEQPQQLAKRRASSQGRKKAQAIEWPHEYPTARQLADAGFFYKPSPDAPDNVQCFTCAVKLDGWEATDNPLQEHLAHSSSCAWAICQSVVPLDGKDLEARDPMEENLVEARRATFEVGTGWPHETKRGWRCKIVKMVASGWCFDPSPDTEDGATCFYCSLSLDGWEPKDDPMAEHRKRVPECPFFALLEAHGSSAPAATKGKAKGKARGSTASRLSVQSVVSVAQSEAPSMPDSVGSATGVDDSVMSTSQAGGKAKKRGPGRPKKGAKSKAVEADATDEVRYPELGLQGDADEIRVPIGSVLPDEPVAAKAVPKKRGRPSKQDSSIVEISHLDAAPKAKSGRKAKQSVIEEPEVPIQAFEQRLSDVSAQLQADLERSFEFPEAESTPQMVVEKPKRGTKRTSTGAPKRETDGSVTVMQFPQPPSSANAGKGKTGRKSVELAAVEILTSEHEELVAAISDAVSSAVPAKSSKAKKPAAKKGKGRKASSTRSSKASATASVLQATPEVEDLARDEAEIEAELARIAREQELVANQSEQDRIAEYEPSPSHPTPKPSNATSQTAAHIHALEQELQQEAAHISKPGHNMAHYVSQVATISPGVRVGTEIVLHEDTASPPRPITATPSPAASDKENMPSTAVPATAMKLADPRANIYLSPMKTTRIPLAPATPNASRLSPTKHLSPSKTNLTALSTTLPWTAIDLDTVLLASPQPTPGRLAGQLVAAAGGLDDREKGMTVEEWIYYRAEIGEAELKRKCDGMVEAFEREAGRGLEVLAGIRVAS
nr:hypothetical protein B0A51_06997 [Rachicladosporium sp. CCFEE 5018]